MTRLRRLSIHLSSVPHSSSAGRLAKEHFSLILPKTKRAAFQILLQKLRPDSNLETDSLISCPSLVRVTREKRAASAPYFSIISIGSIPLPLDFDIRCPFSSRIVPLI